MRNTQATIRDIAIKLNISISTVSRALRGAPDVNQETKKAVLEMAEKLNYEPNRVAQSLRIKRTNTLGIIVPEISLHFFSSAISGMQEEAAQHGYSIMICQSLESFETEKQNVHMLAANRVDGLLISMSSETKDVAHIQSLINKNIPVVLFDRVSDALPVAKVVVDDHDGAFKATEHLIQTGCRRIAYIGGPLTFYISNQRKRGYLDALLHHNIIPDEQLIVHCHELHTEPLEQVKRLLSLPKTQQPDALFCLNDPIAVPVLQLLKEKNIRVPEEISVVGFTNEPVSAFIEPSLTTVSQPSHEMGKKAIELFLEQSHDLDNFTPVTATMKTTLLVRNSTRKV
ncbi:LacI family DNA-binding transcriptional regulator [Chryseolinea lacunae]|uniref:LacI family DNA-binding transcriptional regulator n=1 Tax=Chryseolinea lacunae TaxID=2801331 RepID=A0ABS1L171_9BACT|nr:LacI family DNA-binding transcriptional regulator [Chryseolinea lacunae]MBL0745456.1 LacI family DNA-binding transcriptional regulator [Chryseolinea lacunae]